MADRKYYCFCESGCRFETLNKEQILTAITQAVNDGTVGNVDAGFVTTIKTIDGTPLKFFVGKQSRYEELTEDEKQNLFAIITNDTTKEGIEKAIEGLRSDVDGLCETLADGSFIVKEASHAESATNATSATKAVQAALAESATTASALALGYGELNEMSYLPEKGYYFVAAEYQMLGVPVVISFGIGYWDGSGGAYFPSAYLYNLTIKPITGEIQVTERSWQNYAQSTDITSDCTLRVVKIGE